MIRGMHLHAILIEYTSLSDGPPKEDILVLQCNTQIPQIISISIYYISIIGRQFKKVVILAGLQQRKREGNSNFSIFSTLKGY